MAKRSALSADPPRPTPTEGVFRRDGDFWTLSFGGKVVRAKDAKGLRYIARLLQRPGEEIHVLDLAQSESRLPGRRDGYHRMTSDELSAEGLRTASASLQQDVLDRPARAAYKVRLRELEEALADAEEMGDIAAAERASTERDAIVAELTSAYGLGGRARKVPGDSAERARKAVTERIRTILAHIETVHPALGTHLRRFVRTGTFCSYVPDAPVDWVMEDGTSEPVSTDRRPSRLDVMIVDDHPLWRNTLRKVLEHEGLATVVAEASDGAEALEVALRLRPDVVLMDMGLPRMRGTEVTRALVEVWPEAKVLVLSSCDEREEVIDAVAAGAGGYLLKTAEAAEIADAVQRIHAGELVFPPPLSRMVLAELRCRGARDRKRGGERL